MVPGLTRMVVELALDGQDGERELADDILNEIEPAVYAFTLIAGALAIYNSLETLFLIFDTFTKYRSLYFASLVGCAIGIFLFAVGFLDLFFKWYVNFSIYRPLIVLTIGWYGMVTGFALVMYSRLAIIRASPTAIKWIGRFIVYNICFSHFPTTTFTFGANVIQTDFWVHGYGVIERIQMTFFCIQEVILSILYLIYIQKSAKGAGSKKFEKLAKHTMRVNVAVLVLDIGMLILEYVGLYKYQIMMKVFVYSIKLKLEFYILNILTGTLKAPNSSSASVHPSSKRPSHVSNAPSSCKEGSN